MAARSGFANNAEGSAQRNLARDRDAADRQMEHQGESFKEEGGFREKLSGVRIEARAKQEGAPECPECGKPMARRKARSGKNVGGEFWGCTGYPECTGTREVEGSRGSREST